MNIQKRVPTTEQHIGVLVVVVIRTMAFLSLESDKLFIFEIPSMLSLAFGPIPSQEIPASNEKEERKEGLRMRCFGEGE